MKQKLCLGDCYALAKYKPKQYRIRYISLLAVLTSMCLYAVKQVSAQVAEPAATAVVDIKPLQIGDTIPEWLWHHPLQVVNHPDGKDTITLNDYRGKLIILDFWATWCGPCIHGLNKLDSVSRLPEPNKDNFVVIPATYQKRSDVIGPIHHFGWSLYSICADTLLSQLFPHAGLPHQIWINKNKVFAIPPPQFTTREIIKDVLAGKTVSLPSDRIPFPIPTIPSESPDFWRLTKGDPIYFSQAPVFVPQAKGVLFLMGNVRLIRDLFGFAYEPIVSKYHSRLEPPNTPGSFVELEISDSLKQQLLSDFPHEEGFSSSLIYHQASTKWIADHTYTYMHFRHVDDLTFEDEYAFLRKILNDQLGQEMGIQGHVEKRAKTMAFVRLIKPVNQVMHSLGSADDVSPQPYELLRSAIRRALPRGIPLVNDAELENLKPRWAIKLPQNPTVDELNALLIPHGIVVETKDELVPLLIISEKRKVTN